MGWGKRLYISIYISMIMTIFNTQYRPNAAKLGRETALYPTDALAEYQSSEKGVGEAQGRVGLMGGKGTQWAGRYRDGRKRRGKHGGSWERVAEGPQTCA